MPPAVPQSSHRDALLAANRAVIERIRTAVAGIPPDKLLRQPPTGGWSIAEVLEHLIVSADSYLALIGPVVQGNDGRAAAGDAIWKPSLMGGLLVQSFRSSRKMPAPKLYKPGPSPRPRALEEFSKRQEDVARLIADADGIDWRTTRLSSPVMSLIRMNLGDAFTVLVAHAERHAGQIERVRKAVVVE